VGQNLRTAAMETSQSELVEHWSSHVGGCGLIPYRTNTWGPVKITEEKVLSLLLFTSVNGY
jgi:hypothetical protein